MSQEVYFIHTDLIMIVLLENGVFFKGSSFTMQEITEIDKFMY